MRTLSEIEVAYHLNFKRWRDFQISLRDQLIPRPDKNLYDGPRWSEERIEKWLAGTIDDSDCDSDEQELIDRLTNGKDSVSDQQGA